MWSNKYSKVIIIQNIKTFNNFNFKIPFFNQVEKDIEIEYGDVINNVDIYVNHKSHSKFQTNYKNVYKEIENDSNYNIPMFNDLADAVEYVIKNDINN